MRARVEGEDDVCEGVLVLPTEPERPPPHRQHGDHRGTFLSEAQIHAHEMVCEAPRGGGQRGAVSLKALPEQVHHHVVLVATASRELERPEDALDISTFRRGPVPRLGACLELHPFLFFLWRR